MSAEALFDRGARRRLYNGGFVVLCTLATAVALVALAAILFSLLRNGLGGFGLNVLPRIPRHPGHREGCATPFWAQSCFASQP